MGKYLGLDECDTYEIYMILNGLTEHQFPNIYYSMWIRKMTQIYGKEKNCPKHFYAGNYIVQDHQDFHAWIAEHYKDILPVNL